MTIAAALAGAALLVALIALGLALSVMHQNAGVVDELRAHRRAHARAYGTSDPDRRQRDAGPPAGQPDRRRRPQPIPPLPPARRADRDATTQMPAAPPPAHPARRRGDLA